MPTTCTCGAPLPEDARFCHRCGKPQREEDIPAKEAPPISRVAGESPIAAAVGGSALGGSALGGSALGGSALTFNNPLALRTALLVASVTAILEIVPLMIFIAPIFGGFVAVALYQRRTGRAISIGSAAKLAWITAIINALLFTVWMILNLLLEGGAILDSVRENLKHQMITGPQQEALRMLSEPWMLGVTVVLAWIMLFVVTSALYIAGGALGAKFFKQRTS